MEGCLEKDEWSFHEGLGFFLRQNPLSWLDLLPLKQDRDSFSSSAWMGHVVDIPWHLETPSPKPSLHSFLKRQEEYFPFIHIAFFPGNPSTILVAKGYFTC